mgnify:CR=1 FL=1
MCQRGGRGPLPPHSQLHHHHSRQRSGLCPQSCRTKRDRLVSSLNSGLYLFYRKITFRTYKHKDFVIILDISRLNFLKEIKRIIIDGSRVIISGDISALPKKTQKTINEAIEKTKECKNFVFNICLNYGGKTEIVRAAKLLAEEVKNNKIKIEDIDENAFSNHLYTAGLPDVDLLIRTSGELRTSNYLPWQLAYAEFIFPETPWPDFTKEEFRKCINEYYSRNRRFGGINDDEK